MIIYSRGALHLATSLSPVHTSNNVEATLNMFNLFRLYRKDEILRHSFDFVAVCGNRVECCFDIVAVVDGALLNLR